MPHCGLGDKFRRPNETQSSGIEDDVVEQWVIDIGIEIAPEVATSCMVRLPDHFSCVLFRKNKIVTGMLNPVL